MNIYIAELRYKLRIIALNNPDYLEVVNLNIRLAA